MQVRARSSELRCPLCFATLGGAEARACERCRTETHEACARELAVGCPTPGCRPASARTRIGAAADAEGWQWALLPVGLVLMAVLFAVWFQRRWEPETYEPYRGPTRALGEETKKIPAGPTSSARTGG